MKRIFSLVFVCGFVFSLGSTSKNERLYQVITSHPHHLDEINGSVETVYQEGRLWIVELKDGASDEVKEHLRPISGREKSYFARPMIKMVNMKIARSATKQTLIGVDPERIRKDVEMLASYRTRRTGTEENLKALEVIKERLQSLGYTAETSCFRVNACSVIADKVGNEKKDQVLLVMAHMDSVGKDFAGADDNASGTAVLLEMARILKDFKNQNTLRFFITNGEEQGMLGARYYVNELKKSGKIRNISYAINMDMVGYNDNGVVELETGPQFEKEVQWMARLVQKHTTLTPKITLGAWGSDHVPFINAGVPTVLIIEDWETKTPCYHQACDVPQGLNYDYAAQIGKLNAAALMEKDREYWFPRNLNDI